MRTPAILLFAALVPAGAIAAEHSDGLILTGASTPAENTAGQGQQDDPAIKGENHPNAPKTTESENGSRTVEQGGTTTTTGSPGPARPPNPSGKTSDRSGMANPSQTPSDQNTTDQKNTKTKTNK
jgi:hypothetical protein